ncbi:peroxiredoxin Q/BCP [Parvibaculum indicum]|uniref:thioredoxin-dependent thiol peroxidase n=1 Tax=Parvibaculum indicum TaxID=562969 RepID=UPI00141F1493|nr:thioredoxin-dependent thiol peroxidase [Parvibaculum indicum]NIJ42628.1 peroxiredoxin Q/BCP [Parvibaculum indicum]
MATTPGKSASKPKTKAGAGASTTKTRGAAKSGASAAKKTASTKAAAKAADSPFPPEGKKAPAFSLPADDGSTVKLKDFAGQKVVIYFYPKDNTPGCTTEAIAFSALKKQFDKAGTVVLGVSKDSVQKHCNFRDKHDLTVRLLSDEEGKMIEAYGAWQEKSLYGRKFMGIVRSTLLLDEKGVVRRVWPKVKVKGHAEEVLEAARAL